ncbi:Putative cell wall binding repeat-containing protein [Granulicatella balaenopterae]|uniref:Putative cell wall binding repeat-containing protein n=1 Tax=Granulicatella balaenopterae TaxID=137733 RepID=A0A1H9GSY0_9LACT|nr:N-acetylmuramoyl-L-alanine amidase family protein [Granulicatella balaenopterae]SEQ53216.1 Putative cell wall binding repeat-containing protein [Granulicatella balaenopterae]
MKKKLVTIGVAVTLLAAITGEEVNAQSNGWSQNEVGYTYIKDGSTVKNTWEYIGGRWYHFDNQGQMQTDWQYIGGNWYHFNQNGHMQTDWQYIDGFWYYFNQYGHMQTGWQYIGTSWYYLYQSGACMVNGWQDGTYVDGSGRAVQTGWVKRQGDWYYISGKGYLANSWVGDYYLRADGRMARNTWVSNYYVGATGACVYNAFVGDWYVGSNGQVVTSKWVQQDGNWYYIASNGKVMRNASFIDGSTEYTFGSNGTITSTKQIGRTATIGGVTSPVVSTTEITYSSENYVYEYTPIPNYYVAERLSKAGAAVHALRVGDTVTIEGKNYRVKERKTGITYYDTTAFSNYLSSGDYDLGLQTCDDAATYIIILKLTRI